MEKELEEEYLAGVVVGWRLGWIRGEWMQLSGWLQFEPAAFHHDGVDPSSLDDTA